MEHHPQLIPDFLCNDGPDLFFGLRKDALRDIERAELGMRQTA